MVFQKLASHIIPLKLPVECPRRESYAELTNNLPSADERKTQRERVQSRICEVEVGAKRAAIIRV